MAVRILITAVKEPWVSSLSLLPPFFITDIQDLATSFNHFSSELKMSEDTSSKQGPKWLRWAELPARKDVYTYAGTTRWGNHDLYPIPQKERTFGWLAYFAYWVTTGVSVGTFTLGSTYIALGLNAGETLGAILAGCIFSDLVGCFCGKPGMDYSIGYVRNTPLLTTATGPPENPC